MYTEYRKSHLNPDVQYAASSFEGRLRHPLYINIVHTEKKF